MNKSKKSLSLFLSLILVLSMTAVFGITVSAEGSAPSGNFITFSSAESFTINAHLYWNGSMEYSTNGTDWTTYEGNNALTATQGGTGNYYLYFRGKNNSVITGNNPLPQWSIEGNSVACSGNIENLLDYNTVALGNHPGMNDYCFFNMFYDCRSLVTAPTLPATTLANNCYASMFTNCTSLVTAPALPATTLADSCYEFMFYGCSSLVNVPALPATTLADYCYQNMFSGCRSLVTAPTLPATTLADYCYQNMFEGCTSLVTAPALPATTLAESCYYLMFSGCTSLVTAPALPATTLAESCYHSMFSLCRSLVKAPALPATTLANNCYTSMFSNCSSLVNVPALPATTLAANCYSFMFNNCTGIKLYNNVADAGSNPVAWGIPSGANGDGLVNWNNSMLKNTGGTFKSDPVIGTTYYYPNTPLEVEDADVTGVYQVGAPETVYSVSISWGSMEFTYTAASEGEWDAENMKYINQTPAGWSCADDANKITVTNRSNAAVNASFAFAPEAGFAGGFYDAATGGTPILENTLTLASAAPVGEVTTGTEQSAAAYIQITTGTLTSGQSGVTIGRITVTITD